MGGQFNKVVIQSLPYSKICPIDVSFHIDQNNDMVDVKLSQSFKEELARIHDTHLKCPHVGDANGKDNGWSLTCWFTLLN